MIRLSPGVRITRRDGRQMIVRAVAEIDGMLVVHWAQIVAEKAAA